MDQQNINAVKTELSTLLEGATKEQLTEIKVKYIGKKGIITALLKSLKDVPPEQKAEVGERINSLREFAINAINQKEEYFENIEQEKIFEKEKIDVTEPARKFTLGNEHPIQKTIDEIKSIFTSIGYSVVFGPEVETVHNNFDALNAPKNHPSREKTDTFYISDNVLLRTQTSPVQIRTLLKNKPPVKVIAPGRCFRADTPDATHSPMFHQVEGLLVDENITFADLKGTLDYFAKEMFGSDVKTKFRPHYFPFTEPSSEMDMTCFSCGGKGCPICKGSGWIEILGCGMVHPNVLEHCDVDKKWSGFAFGMGVERIAMLKYGIEDIRLFYENDVRFIRQF